MSLGMRRPAFTVVSSSVAALVLLGFAVRYLQPHIPKRIENKLGKEKSDFLSRAATQRIDWRKPSMEAFAAARRRDIPILLFIGSSHSPLARSIDEGPLQLARVQAFLARNFQCIRADTLDYPEYRNAFLPVQRGISRIPTGCQLWVLDPSGKIIGRVDEGIALKISDGDAFVGALLQARREFERLGSSATTPLEEFQRRDATALQEPEGQTAPPFAEYQSHLIGSIYKKGGFGAADSRSLVPEAWRYLLGSGRTEDFRTSIDPVLMSPLVDLIDGGFFQGSRDPDWLEVDFDKSAIANSDMLRILSSAWGILRDPIYLYLAERTFDSLTTEFASDQGFTACRPSDAGKDQRSVRSSFGVRKLRETLTEEADYRWAQEYLGLRVATNPRMAPRLDSAKTLEDRQQLQRVLGLLTKGTGKKPICKSAGFTDVTGYCVARLLESARMLGEPSRMEVAVKLFDLVEQNDIENVILHGQDSETQTAYLGDYLSYVDACLQYYLATGRNATLLLGRKVLLRTLKEFGGNRPGTLHLGIKRDPPLPESLSLPEISDPIAESATAQAIRLCNDYARIFPKDEAFAAFAGAAAWNYGPIARALGPRGAGFFLAAQSVIDTEFFVSVGPRAQEWADKLMESHPFRLSLAAFGETRADIRSKGPGVYVVRGEVVQGPMTPDEASKIVSPFLGPRL
jgi:uncharacterized protein YyaL (SSP411 family)